MLLIPGVQFCRWLFHSTFHRLRGFGLHLLGSLGRKEGAIHSQLLQLAVRSFNCLAGAASEAELNSACMQHIYIYVNHVDVCVRIDMYYVLCTCIFAYALCICVDISVYVHIHIDSF